MASSSSSLHFVILTSLFISISTSKRPDASPVPISLPIVKIDNTLQYITHTDIGTPSSTLNLVVDLGAALLWMDCETEHLSSSYTPTRCRSIQCSTANANKCGTSFTGLNTCNLLAKNTLTGKSTDTELGEDIVLMNRILFSCAPTLLLQGLPTDTKGIVGLGRSRTSLPSQLAGVHQKFSICLPSSTKSNGAIYFNTNLYSGVSNILTEVSKSLMYTPLIALAESNEYYIGVKSIKINGKQLLLNTSSGGTRLSTVVPYTTMQTSIYNAFTQAFAKSTSMTKVASVAPFKNCFGSRVGATVPVIDLLLQSNMVKWRIHGSNSMVRVSDEIMCLGFIDGGLNPRDGDIVVGGYQLENNLLEFDLASSRLGFTSLSQRQLECSDINLQTESSGL